MKPVVLSFFEYTGTMLKPWAEAGYLSVQHSNSGASSVKQFISPRSAMSAGREALKPGWSLEVFSKTVFNRDRSADVVFGVKFFDRNGLPSGVLR